MDTITAIARNVENQLKHKTYASRQEQVALIMLKDTIVQFFRANREFQEELFLLEEALNKLRLDRLSEKISDSVFTVQIEHEQLLLEDIKNRVRQTHNRMDSLLNHVDVITID
jgi:outer membrane protein assembly factor BamD (BamD/ComL family)